MLDDISSWFETPTLSYHSFSGILRRGSRRQHVFSLRRRWNRSTTDEIRIHDWEPSRGLETIPEDKTSEGNQPFIVWYIINVITLINSRTNMKDRFFSTSRSLKSTAHNSLPNDFSGLQFEVISSTIMVIRYLIRLIKGSTETRLTKCRGPSGKCWIPSSKRESPKRLWWF